MPERTPSLLRLNPEPEGRFSIVHVGLPDAMKLKLAGVPTLKLAVLVFTNTGFAFEGVTSTEVDATLSPIEFFAFKVMVYEVPLVRLGITTGDKASAGFNSV